MEKIKFTIITLTLLAMLMLCGCERNRVPGVCTGTCQVTNNYKIVVIDSCEYIRVRGIYGLVHKGNCRYCEEKHRKEGL